MSHDSPVRYIAFAGHRRLADGDLRTVAVAVKRHVDARVPEPIAVFDAVTAHPVDLDLHGSEEELRARLETAPSAAATSAGREGHRGPGRPKLGVASREVSLLPRHWDWLTTQPGGASATLRRLVEEARRANAGRDRARASQEAAYRFMHSMAGDLEGFEDAIRALYRSEYGELRGILSGWPADVASHALALVDAAERDGRAADAPADPA